MAALPDCTGLKNGPRTEPIAMGAAISSLYTATFALCLVSAGLVRERSISCARRSHWLTWFLIFQSASFACEVLMAHPDAPLKGLWLGLRLGFSLFISPCLWLAVREAAENSRPRWLDLGRPHFAPIGAGLLLTLPVIADADPGVTFSHPDRPISPAHARIILGSMLGCIAIFAVQVPLYLRRCRSVLTARAGAAGLGWAEAPLWAVAATWTFGLLRTLQCAAHLPRWIVAASVMLEVAVTGGSVYVLLRRIVQMPPLDLAETECLPAPPKYRRSPLTPALRERIQRKLIDALASEAVCHDSLLSLRSLSRHLNEKDHYVSQVISQDLGANFFELVNRSRIERACSLLLAEPGRTVLEIAVAVGYNSKSTFNSAFRRHTGVTPTEFRARADRLDQP